MKGRGHIWIQGAGELASGVAVRLFRSGFRVVMAETPRPLAVRRQVCFSEAVYSGLAEVEGVNGALLSPDESTYQPDLVAVVVDPDASVLKRLGADAVVDARMTKKAPAALPRGTAPLIGLGPGFTCGRDADLIIETHREAQLGTVIDQGCAMPDTGIPGPVGGETGLRLLRAPAAGNLVPLFEIGDLVEEGVVVGHVGGLPVVSGLKGVIRGLVHPEAELLAGDKVGDVDPRSGGLDTALISDKALAVAGGVLEALHRLKILPAWG